jgi:SAM-dependent methyltransferase
MFDEKRAFFLILLLFPRMSKTTDEAILKFYGREAEKYCERTVAAPTPTLGEFLNRLPRSATILELGCGSGRDSAEMLRRGYNVLAIDGSPEMAQQAERLLHRPVMVLEFGNIDGEAKFDGVWAGASLLHIPIEHLGDVVARIHRILRPSGVLFSSFKAGEREGRDRFGRYYNYSSRFLLKAIIEQTAFWASLEIQEAPGMGYDGVSVTWLNCTATKV